MSESSSVKISKIVRVLGDSYGHLDWWRGSAEEVMIGAILTQQTRWENVGKALSQLRQQGLNTLRGILDASDDTIEEAIRCTGFFRVKTRRLKNLAATLIERYGTIGHMEGRPTGELRQVLCSVKGVGDETADSILCYALERPSFVIDTYTEVICSCAGIPEKKNSLKCVFEAALPSDFRVFQQTHAHIVEFAKEWCGKKRCGECWIPNLNE